MDTEELHLRLFYHKRSSCHRKPRGCRNRKCDLQDHLICPQSEPVLFHIILCQQKFIFKLTNVVIHTACTNYTKGDEVMKKPEEVLLGVIKMIHDLRSSIKIE